MERRVHMMLPDDHFICVGNINEKDQDNKRVIEKENNEELERLKSMI